MTTTVSRPRSSTDLKAYSAIDFIKAQKLALKFAATIENEIEQLTEILLEYESYEVVQDEISRTLDLLKNLEENKRYFSLRIGAVASFLPRNQPLYALTCFVVIPSLMSSEVHFRVPHSMRHFLPKVLEVLNLYKIFPNIYVSDKQRIPFLHERTALLVNPETDEQRPITEAVIFTGTSAHADQLRLIFDRKTLFIANGSGHNPVVITENANLSDAIEAVLSLGLYNQGQDCASPNSILIHQKVYNDFLQSLRLGLSKIKIGPYEDRSIRVGPINDPEDLKRIETLIVDNREWLDESTSGTIHTAEAIVEPTIICKPLKEGGNYREVFAPIFFVQQYTNDDELGMYFENHHYALNAMYVMLYGDSKYVTSLLTKPIEGKILLDKKTLLHNTHLHIPGIERGTQPYGGYGHGASSISINGEVHAKPTLPQRDIYEHIVKPVLKKKSLDEYYKYLAKFTKVQHKNIEKLLKLRSHKTESAAPAKLSEHTYIDIQAVKANGARYIRIEEEDMHHLLSTPNAECISTLGSQDIKAIQELTTLLSKKAQLTPNEFLTSLYAIPKDPGLLELENKNRQLHFFKKVYQLLFGKDSGPRLGPFLWELKDDTVKHLLDV